MAGVDALTAEAEGAGGSFEFGGETFTLPAKLDFRAVVALQRGNIDRALTILLGAEQMGRLIDVDTDEVMDADRLDAIFSQMHGGSSGESGASTAS